MSFGSLVNPDLDANTRTALGQFMTPPPVAALLASVFDLPSDARLLDAGAGVGSLSAAVADRWASMGTGMLDVTAVEMDPTMLGGLAATVDDLAAAGVKASAVAADFVEWGVERTAGFEAAGRRDVLVGDDFGGPRHRRRTDEQPRQQTAAPGLAVVAKVTVPAPGTKSIPNAGCARVTRVDQSTDTVRPDGSESSTPSSIVVVSASA